MITRTALTDCGAVARLAVLLWPDNALEQMEAEVSGILTDEDSAVFLAVEGRRAVGFSQCGLRRDYVEGTKSKPVGYLEGIYVEEKFRMRGIARELLATCEEWARDMGCTEFASDCELENDESLAFHLRVGFTEANRIICFHKPL